MAETAEESPPDADGQLRTFGKYAVSLVAIVTSLFHL